MISRSNPNLSQQHSKPFRLPGKAVSNPPSAATHKKVVNEKGDAGTLCSERLELLKDARRLNPNVRRQQSAPFLSTVKAEKSDTSISQATRKARPHSSIPTTSQDDKAIAVADAKASLSSDSIISSTNSTSTEPICDALQKDSKLKALCVSLGIGQSPNTLVGPIEKGQLIVGTLQESLHNLIKLKIKKAERKGEKFHIQQSGLDAAVRALRNAERSLKTIKESKQPILGRARHQRSTETLLQCHRKTNDAVIRILSNTKEKFDKMGTGSGMNKFLGGISLVSAYLSSSTPPPSTGFSGYTTRRTTGSSILTTPVTPYNTTTATSRARTATSSTSIGGGGCRGSGAHSKLIPTM